MLRRETLMPLAPIEPTEPKSQGGELPGIQILRGLAALGVVIHHTLEQSNHARHRFSPDWLTISGAAGVDIFFVISGFIMLYVSFGRPIPVSPRAFLVRRIKRIYPFYWLCCLAMLCVYAAGFLKHNPLNAYDVLASFLLLPSKAALINVSWTLVFEMYFYLIFAATLSFRSVRATVIVSTFVIFALIVCGKIWRYGTVGAFLSNPIPLEFCMGLWLGWAFLRRHTWPAWTATGLAGFVFLAISSHLVPHADTHGLPGLARVWAWGIPAALIVAGALNIPAPKSHLSRFLVLLGDASYALYLTHEFLMIGYGWLIKKTFFGGTDQIYVAPFIVLAAVLAGLLAYLFVERPLTGMMRNRGVVRIDALSKSAPF